MARVVANAFLRGPWQQKALMARVTETLGHQPEWALRAARRAVRQFPQPPLDRRDELARFLLTDKLFASSPPEPSSGAMVRHFFLYEPAMGPQRWPVPAIATVGGLADWLRIDVGTLEWLADQKGLERVARASTLLNYHYRWVEKRRGGWRLIEAPKLQLKELQRRVLHGILDLIPPHEAAHGFRRARSVHSYVMPHVKRALVLRLDLSDFFARIAASRVFGLFRTAGYPEDVARILTALCTNRTPRPVLREKLDRLEEQPFQRPHLPQGAPTSPAVANLCAFRLDARLDALARRAGGVYTRYADDLAFSFDKSPSTDRFLTLAATIAIDEGFEVNFRKTRCQSAAVRQTLGGVVVNERPNIARDDYDRLKATLYNCVKSGPSTQGSHDAGEFRARLLGQIDWVTSLHRKRGETLRRMFNQIDWTR